jgi:hypothetical protein
VWRRKSLRHAEVSKAEAERRKKWGIVGADALPVGGRERGGVR